MKKVILFIGLLLVFFFIATCYGLQQSEREDYIVNEDTTVVLALAKTENTTIQKNYQIEDFLPAPILHKPEIILRRKAYVLSYNMDIRMANWVAWKLTKEHTDGQYSRKGVPYYDEKGNAIGIASFSAEVLRGDYFIDMQVPSPRQEHSDWKEHPSWIDHGHMCPAADCKWDREAMNQSFLLTNMCPQDHDLNGGDWDKLENKCRTWAKRYEQIYIVAGPLFNSEEVFCFGNNKIPIPESFFKVILCMEGTPKALGFIFANNGTHHPLEERIMTVDEVEKRSGIDFFTNLPDKLENEIEAFSNLNSW